MKILKTKIMPRSVIIGDIHSCNAMLTKMIEVCQREGVQNFIFLGDILDRGDSPLQTVKTLLSIKDISTFLLGNHDWKMCRKYYGAGVSLSEEQANNVKIFNEDSVDMFKNYCSLFYDEYVGLIDSEQKVMLSHALGGRPSRFLEKYEKHEIGKNDYQRMLYGLTENDTFNGLPIRLALTNRVDDDLEGWITIHGHTHGNRLYSEMSKNVMCLDFKAGQQPDGRLAGWVIDNDVRNGRLLVINQQLLESWNPEADMKPYTQASP